MPGDTQQHVADNRLISSPLSSETRNAVPHTRYKQNSLTFHYLNLMKLIQKNKEINDLHLF